VTVRSRSSAPRDLLGQSLTWLCGGALALNLLLILGLLALIAVQGLGFFWQKDLLLLTLTDGTRVFAEIHEREVRPAAAGGPRLRLKTGNRDLTGLDFRWVEESAIAGRERPRDAVLLERLEWGNFHGRAVELRHDGEVRATGAGVWEAFGPVHEAGLRLRRRVERLERGDIGTVNMEIERLRLERRRIEMGGADPARRAARLSEVAAREAAAQERFAVLAGRLATERREMERDVLVMEAADGQRKEVAAGQIVTALRPNTLSVGERAWLYLTRTWTFVSGDPRESNTEGGIFPAIFGTVMMVFIMSFAVAPLGIIAALYLREYAHQGPLVRLVRIAVNNLAGVPSIVFGVFGLGFFVYLVGGTIDRMFYAEALPTPTFGTGGILWASLTLALLTVPVVIVATEEGLAAVPRIMREGSLALGATKLETTWRVVLPAAAPGILTGLILAMARAAGEVAPLMIVGMVKLAPQLPIDTTAPFLHLERKFMHLGFHIYDVGFQSPNVEATKPLVFATALLLIVTVTLMNLVAIALRNHLRRRYASSVV